MNWFKSRRKCCGKPTGESTNMPSEESMNNLTPRAQQVLALARKEADRFNHNFVGTEHLLLGLIKLGQGVAVNVLQKLGLDLETVRTEVEKQVGTGPDQKMIGTLPYTPRVKKVLFLANKEAKALNHSYVGTEHILLGLLGEGDNVAARVLKNLDVDTAHVRQEVLKELDPNYTQPAEATAKPASPETPKPHDDLIDTSKRYDVYCAEPNQQIAIRRNVLFKSAKKLFPISSYDSLAVYIELEQADGQRIFIARSSIIKFCEHAAPADPGAVPDKQA
jgi:hypothetical protein